MKKLFGLFICLLMVALCAAALAEIAIDETNFPDAAFRSEIADQFDKDGNKSLSDEEVAGITRIELNQKGILSLKGIEKFTELTELSCSRNNLSELDVTKNTKITNLDCSNNHLSSIDVSHNAELLSLHCSYNQIKELDLSKNKRLSWLDCRENQLKTLDLSHCPNSSWIFCNSNQLQTVTLGSLPEMERFCCDDNQLTSLDLSGAPLLNHINCDHNKLQALDFSACPVIKDLICNNNSLKTINLKGCTKLEQLYCEENSLTTLDVSDCPTLCGYLRDYKRKAAHGFNGGFHDLIGDSNNVQFSVDTGVTIIAGATTYEPVSFLISVTSGGNGTAECGIQIAETGEEVKLSSEANKGYHFKEWQVISGDVTVNNDKFIMGKADVELKAIFEADSETPSGDDEPGDIILSKSKLTIKNGKAETVIASLSNPDDSIVKVKSSDKKVVKVKCSGDKITITPYKKAGKATVTVKTAKGAEAKLTVTVKEGWELNEKSITLKKGEKFKIKVSAFPSSIKAKNFESSKPKVAKVDKKGKITAKKKGKTTITVTLSNGKELKLKVTVK